MVEAHLAAAKASRRKTMRHHPIPKTVVEAWPIPVTREVAGIAEVIDLASVLHKKQHERRRPLEMQ
jgi:hypothetical protein